MSTIEEKYFRLSILGVLSSRKFFQEEYGIQKFTTKTIAKEFIKIENISENKWKILKEDEDLNIKIKRIRNLATKERQEGFGGRNIFLKWYLDEPKICCYCGVKEIKLQEYFTSDNLQYYRNEDDKARQRGVFLEIERVKTAGKEVNKYTKGNTRLACYICNNAKSDFISPSDFEPIAKGINTFWKNKKVLIEEFNSDNYKKMLDELK